MTILRVLKWFFFIVFILAIALCGVGNYFVCADMGLCTKDDGDNVKMLDIKKALEERDALKDLFTFGGEAESPDDEADPSPTTAVSGAVSLRPGDSTQPSTPTEPTVAPDYTPAVSQPDESEPESGYNLDKHGNFVIALMKYGTLSTSIDWLLPDSVKDTNEADQQSSREEAMKYSGVNVALCAAYCSLFLAFLFHLITKRYKTFYGTLLMILGYLLFAAVIAGGYYGCMYAINKFSATFTSDDYPFYQAMIITCCLALGTLIGLPIYSCGVRQITNRRLKNRLTRRSNKY